MYIGGIPPLEGEAWNVGQLRQALDGIPDETPLVMLVTDLETCEVEGYDVVDGSLASASVDPRIAPQDDELMLLCRLQNVAEED